MLPQLTKYLLQFHQVHIPSLGTVRLVQQPASLDVAAKRLYPPTFALRFSEDGWLTKHQLWYFGSQLHFDEEATRNSLEDVGEQLKKSLAHQPFVWTGIGTFRYSNEQLQFEPVQLEEVLQPVTAERVLREGVHHSVLVGDQVVLSNGNVEISEAEERHWNWRRIIGWAAVILSVFFIIYFLYQHQFNPTATGMFEKVRAAEPEPTYVQ